MKDNREKFVVDVAEVVSFSDCGPRQVAIGREIRVETAVEIAVWLNRILLEKRPVDEVVMDNSVL